jgi:hypothetical protein
MKHIGRFELFLRGLLNRVRRGSFIRRHSCYSHVVNSVNCLLGKIRSEFELVPLQCRFSLGFVLPMGSFGRESILNLNRHQRHPWRHDIGIIIKDVTIPRLKDGSLNLPALS